MSAISERSSSKPKSSPRKRRTNGAFAKFANKLSGRVVKTISQLPAEQQRRLLVREKALTQAVQSAVEELAAEMDNNRTTIKVAKPQEHKVGKGLGKPLSAAAGRARLLEYATAQRIEDWAGDVAGATEIQRELGISRSTLYSWTTRRAVVSLKSGRNKHVYPLAQFIDGRPVDGIEDVLRVATNSRAAWQWLVQHKPSIGGVPLTLLKAGKVGEVLKAAERDFG